MGSVVLINKKLPMTRKLSDASNGADAVLARCDKIDDCFSVLKLPIAMTLCEASVMRQAALFCKKESPRSIGSFQMRLPVRAPHLARCDKLDDMDFSTKSDHLFRSFPLH